MNSEVYLEVFEVSCDSCEERLLQRLQGLKELIKDTVSIWGLMSTGGGQRKLNEMMASIGIPGMSKSTFIRIETQIGNE